MAAELCNAGCENRVLGPCTDCPGCVLGLPKCLFPTLSVGERRLTFALTMLSSGDVSRI
jgi:hypothetical protein